MDKGIPEKPIMPLIHFLDYTRQCRNLLLMSIKGLNTLVAVPATLGLLRQLHPDPADPRPRG